MAEASTQGTPLKAVHGVLLAAGVVACEFGPVLCVASTDAVQRGHEVFQYWCAPCHAPEPREGGRFLPGTASLRAKYGSEKPAALEDRTDLNAQFIQVIIRRGVAGMPAFRKTEISDREMQDIAAYLARNSR